MNINNSKKRILKYVVWWKMSKEKSIINKFKKDILIEKVIIG